MATARLAMAVNPLSVPALESLAHLPVHQAPASVLPAVLLVVHHRLAHVARQPPFLHLAARLVAGHRVVH